MTQPIFRRDDICYILQNNQPVKVRVVMRRDQMYTVQPVGACGAIQIAQSQLFSTPQDALASRRGTSSAIVKIDITD